MAIKVLKPGLATTVQDAGREGYYNVGIPLSGALDQYSFRAANLLVGNDESAAVLECTLMGPELEFQRDAVIAVTGAEMTPKLDGTPAARNEALRGQGRDGRVVRLHAHRRTRLHRRGRRHRRAGDPGQPFHLRPGRVRRIPGAQAAGRRHRAGRRSQACTPKLGKRVPDDLAMPLPKELELRVVPGLYFHRITDESAQSFFEDTWTVAPEADRIGYRYKQGRPLKFRERKQPFGAGSDPSNIVDAGYPYGSIQVPGGLEPIILHRDAVSGGGYAMIGTVISADMDRIAQMQPNNKARFVKVDLDAALAARAERNQRLQRLRAALA